MIQRIQSLYLLLTSLLSLLLLKGSNISFVNKSEIVYVIGFNGIAKISREQGYEIIEKLLPLSIICMLIPAVALAAVFMFKKRNLQMFFSKVLVVLVILLILFIAYYTFYTINKFDVNILGGIKMALPIIILILSFFALKGIRKDDRLIKSYDRLR